MTILDSKIVTQVLGKKPEKRAYIQRDASPHIGSLSGREQRLI